MDISEIREKNILVIGDFMIDYYHEVFPTKISPEAPVLVVEQSKEWSVPGGAANVANNLTAMGANKVWLASVLGDDNRAGIEYPEQSYESVTEVETGRKTTVKERYITSRQQLLRIDHESRTPVPGYVAMSLYERIVDILDEVDVIVFSDYDKGSLPSLLVKKVINSALDIPIVVDTKAADSLAKYRGCTIAVPNLKEARRFSGQDSMSPGDLAIYLQHRFESESIGLTAGGDGIYFYHEGDESTTRFPASDDKVVDVAGAGDTVTAAVALALAVGMSYHDAMVLANVSAGIVVKKHGVDVACFEEIEKELENV